MCNQEQERGLRKRVTILALTFLAFCARGGSADRAHAAKDDVTDRASAAETHARLFLDFENGRMGTWRFGGYFADIPLEAGLAHDLKNDRSRGALHCSVRDNADSGSITYVLRDNGVPPIRVTRRTRIAWCWRVSENQDTDGFWLCLYLKNTKTKRQDIVRCVNWIEKSHTVLRAYFDPSQVWVYHDESIYDYLWRRYDPSVVDSFVIENVTLGASAAPKLEAWIDNIWIGEGEPPDSVNVVKTVNTSGVVPSRLMGFSYGFLNCDWIPDRVDVYRDRAEVLINPDSGVRRGGRPGIGGSFGMRCEPMKPFQTIPFEPQRIDGFATLADLNGDGMTDVLFNFDDLLGNRCFENRLPRGRFSEVSLRESALKMDMEYSYGAAVSDVDLDGDLDILQFCPYPRSYVFGGIRLLQNNSNFDFDDYTTGSWILSQLAFGCTFGDVNGDGCQDLFAGYRVSYDPDSVKTVARLYLNDRHGHFAAVPEDLVPPPDVFIEGGVFADFDNDGDLDLYVVVNEVQNNSRPPRNMLFLNDGTVKFTDVTETSGVACVGGSQAALAEDFDNDGLIDLYVIGARGSMLYRNLGNAHFQAVPDELICREPGSGGAAVDYDGDGDMDVAVLGTGLPGHMQLMHVENTSSTGKNFIEVRLRGISSNRFGIGGKVFLYETGHLGDKDHLLGMREINSSKGFAQYSPPVAHFGLGTRRAADVEVVFPPARGREPVVVREKNVAGGSFLSVPEYRSGAARALYNFSLSVKQTYRRTSHAIPAWSLAFLAFLVVSAVGILHRTRLRTAWATPADAFALAAIALAAALAIDRSVPWGGTGVLLGALAVAFNVPVEGLVRTVFQSRAWRENVLELLLEDLSQAIHAEKKFAFLMDVSLLDDPVARKPLRSYDEELGNLMNLVSMMRLATPRDASWKEALDETGAIRRLLAQLSSASIEEEGAGQFEHSDRASELRHAVERLVTLLKDYRAMLHRMISVSFIDEWRALRAEYEPALDSQGVILEESFPAGIEVARIHLRTGEFRHIFKNCFDNSLRAMREREEKRIRVAASIDSAMHLELHWADTGCGIPKPLVERLFNEVVQSSSPDGKGEGCFISSQMIRRRLGAVRCERLPKGEGASIFMKFIRSR